MYCTYIVVNYRSSSLNLNVIEKRLHLPFHSEGWLTERPSWRGAVARTIFWISEVLFLFLFCSSAPLKSFRGLGSWPHRAPSGLRPGLQEVICGKPGSVKLSTVMLRDEVSVVLIGG